MIFLPGFICLILFLFASGFFAAAVFSVRAEKVFLPALLLNALLLYAGGILHVHKLAFYLIFAGNLLLYIPAFIQMKKEGWRPVLKRFFTPGILFVLIFLPVFFFAVILGQPFGNWDEISHWGTVAKLFFSSGQMSCESGDILKHASYPPGTCLISALTHFCFFGLPFTESLVIFGNQLLFLGVWLYPMAGFHTDRRFLSIVFLLAFPVSVPAFFAPHFFTAYTDIPLALLFALCTYIIVSTGKYTRGEWFSLGILMAFLFLIRNAGWGYAVMLMFLLACKLFTARHDLSKRDIPGIIWVFLLPCAVKISWICLLKYHNTPMIFEGPAPGDVYQAVFHNEPATAYGTIKLFFRQLCSGALEILAVLLTGFLLLKKYSVSPARRKQAVQSCIFFALAFMIFAVSIMILYIFHFGEYDYLPSYLRYMSTFLLVPAIVLFFQWYEELLDRQSRLPAETGLGCTSIWRKLLLCLLAAGGIYYISAPVHSDLKPYRSHIKKCENMVVKYDSILNRDRIRFTMLSCPDDEFKSFYGAYLYPHNFVRTYYWHPVTKADERYPYTFVTTPEELRSVYIKNNLDYVYVESVTPEFITDFASLFDFAPVTEAELDDTLFRVLPDGRLGRLNP